MWNVVASERHEVFIYDVKWLADMIVNPRRSAGRTAQVLYSPEEGTGKTTFSTLCKALISAKYALPARMKDLRGEFTGQYENKLLIYCNEFYSPTSSSRGVSAADAEGVRSFIYDLIDSDTLTIEHKGRLPYEVPNFARVVLGSNKTILLPSNSGARRFKMTAISTCRMGDHAFWARLHGAIGIGADGQPLPGFKGGGELDAFFTILASLNLSEFSPQKSMPATAEQALQRMVTLGMIENQLFEILKIGNVVVWADGPDGGVWVRQHDIRKMMEARLGHNLPNTYNETWFAANVMKKLMVTPGNSTQKRPRNGGGSLSAYNWPCLRIARELFQERFVKGVKIDWEGENNAWNDDFGG